MQMSILFQTSYILNYGLKKLKLKRNIKIFTYSLGYNQSFSFHITKIQQKYVSKNLEQRDIYQYIQNRTELYKV